MVNDRLSTNQIEDFINRNSLNKDKYKNQYFVYLQSGQDGSLLVTFTKGEPLTLWEFIYHKYFGGSSNYGIVAILTQFGRNQIIEYYADKYLKVDDEYTHHNLAHLHMIRLTSQIPRTLYFYFNKSQREEVTNILSTLLKGVPKDVVSDLVNTIITKSTKGKVAEFVYDRNKSGKLKPVTTRKGE